MDWVFLWVSVVGALYTANALRPISLRHPWLVGWSWFASWLTTELAWLVLATQIGLALIFTLLGALLSPVGWLALAITVASWTGLAFILARSLASGRDITRAFGDHDAPVIEKRGLGVTRTRNLTYARIGHKDLKLDVYQPRRPAPPGERRPAILQIHGGAWVFGDKRTQGLPLVRHLASQGWVGFNANYRLSPRATFPDHLLDLKRALAWIRQHADEYGVDPDFIAVTGGSAGGHLATLLALTANDPQYQRTFRDVDTSVQAAVPFYGVYDFTVARGYYPEKLVRRFFGRVVLKASPRRHPERFEAASAFSHLHPDAPPFLVVHGALDTLAPVQMARDFVAALRSTSQAPVLYLELRGTQHAFEVFRSIRTKQVVKAVDRFLGKLWADHRRGRAPGDVPAEELAGPVDAATTETVTR